MTPRAPKHDRAHAQVVDRLADLLDQAPVDVREYHQGPDLIVSFPHHTFVIEYKSSARVAVIASALRTLNDADPTHHPLVAVPYMGEAGAGLCAQAGVDWLDLSGNAHIVGPGLRILVEGRPNAFLSAGRPRSAFAPKSARITRWLLEHPAQAFSQRDLSAATQVDPGFTSRIVHRLLDDELVERDAEGRIAVSRPSLLLDAWAEDYDFERHQVVPGVVAARSGTELVRRLAEPLARAQARHAFTGLAAAWLYTRFAGFRLATVYLPDGVSESLQRDLGFRNTDRGANTWLVVPDDEGVVHGAAEVDGVRCVHPVQAWLDLKHHPERAAEAAERLRAERLGWAT
ncbi:MAG: MarR family transcriptional regulator [Deltaproteobacteria bacterium]|nr:MAG: MarR family transcriptional regulator [Deltaproteobacteria bacterium]